MILYLPSTKLNKTITQQYSFYSFIIGCFVTLAWCFIVLYLSSRTPVPNFSLFPEIDVSAKMVTQCSAYKALAPYYSIAGMFSRLSNAGSIEIRKQLSLSRFYV